MCFWCNNDSSEKVLCKNCIFHTAVCLKLYYNKVNWDEIMKLSAANEEGDSLTVIQTETNCYFYISDHEDVTMICRYDRFMCDFRASYHWINIGDHPLWFWNIFREYEDITELLEQSISQGYWSTLLNETPFYEQRKIYLLSIFKDELLMKIFSFPENDYLELPVPHRIY